MIINPSKVYPNKFSPLKVYFPGDIVEVNEGSDLVRYYSLNISSSELPLLSTSWRKRIFPYIQPS